MFSRNKKSSQIKYVFLYIESAEDSSGVIDRACGFFLEHNDNYRVSWEEANEKIALGPGQVRTYLILISNLLKTLLEITGVFSLTYLRLISNLLKTHLELT